MTLQADGVGIRFGGVVALTSIDLTVEPGMVQGVIGPNGSGKSTLFNCLSGFVRPSNGRVLLDGVDVTRVPVHQRIGMGMARTFQTPRFDPQTTVADAVACGFYPGAGKGPIASLTWAPWVRSAERRVAREVDELLDRFGLESFRSNEIGQVSLGTVRLVEVARAMAMAPKFLLLDEPAAGLAKDEQQLLADELRKLAEGGVGVLLVEHNFELVLGLCQQILVLASGSELASGTPQEIATNSKVMDTYLGLATDIVDEEMVHP